MAGARREAVVLTADDRLDDDEAALVVAAAPELQACPPCEVVLQPVTALHLVGIIQLALRHPGLQESSAAVGRKFIEIVRTHFRDQGAAAVVEMLRRGDEPTRDR